MRAELRVLYIIDSLAPGGTETSLAALAPVYADLGVSLDVAYLIERPGLHGQLLAAGAGVFSASAGGRLGRLHRVRTLLRERSPDLVHTSLFEADIVGRIASWSCRLPVISSLVNESYGPAHYADPGIRPTKLHAAQVLDAGTARLASRMHAVSGKVAEVMSRRLRYPRGRIDVVPRGRDPHALGRRTSERRHCVRADLGLAESDVMILAVGRQEHQKALHVAVEALAIVCRSVDTARLVIAGREGSATPDVQRARDALHLGDRVMTLGHRDDIADLLCAADVFVATSRREGMPGAVIEAMALEVPIVATDLEQTREVTGTEAALLVRLEDPAAVAEGVLSTLTDPVASTRRVDLAYRRFLDSFTIQRTGRQMVELYDRVLTSAHGTDGRRSAQHEA